MVWYLQVGSLRGHPPMWMGLAQGFTLCNSMPSYLHEPDIIVTQRPNIFLQCFVPNSVIMSFGVSHSPTPLASLGPLTLSTFLWMDPSEKRRVPSLIHPCLLLSLHPFFHQILTVFALEPIPNKAAQGT